MFNKKYINVYRAITGQKIRDPKIDIFTGVTASELRSTGILTSNRTSYGNFSLLESYGMSQNDPTIRSVPGLPVYLSLSEAKGWIIGKKFVENGKPVIAVARLPLNMVIGDIQIWRTSGFEKDDYLLTEKLLLKHLSQKEIISGECDLRGNLERINRFVTFLRPEKMINGYPEGKFIPENRVRREK